MRPADLPYVITSAVSVVVLAAFVAFASPFSPKEAGAATTIPGTTTVAGGATTTTTATTTSLAGDTSTTSAGSAVSLGEQVFNATCIACHGVGGVGVEGLGKPLTTSTFADGLTDDELLAFLIAGRPDDDPLNTTGIAMPPRGGNASLTDDDLRAVVIYLRTLAEA
ncbi:MAG TPA: cytochrome c [Acidimicrobiia bacterium]|nr:cytochrome c [Acidimicrobiia bacterium]